MLNKNFTYFLQSISNEEIIELHLMDPHFLNSLCYMVSLELHLQKEKNN
tara:strand:+ start:9060 stop:9206 length:147 start_codon:yes stop_codon:yes gene_type:complete